MKYFDVFNGDADGLCALHQFRLAEPRPQARLITGVKRDIRLLQQISGTHDAHITVLDISLDSNRDALELLLESGCDILYVDHHYAGEIPLSDKLTVHIDPSPDTCTSLITDRLLGGEYRSWAVVGAFGDNLHTSARQAAASLSLADPAVAKLQELGELLNYNGYGLSITDLFFAPGDLYKSLMPYTDPLEYWEHSDVLSRLREGYRHDMDSALQYKPIRITQAGRIYELPPEPWARRVSGVFSNLKAQEEPSLAHGLLIRNPDDSYRVNIRAPLHNKHGADTICRGFATGGGREAAAGINSLPQDQMALFFRKFEEIFNPGK
ncbi:MAG: acetyltransferase [Desulfobacterales bacterium SG8_35_2]|nr:MAG: acetyltransferase [Desulfobacterales bacterium SG8_35_2]